MDFLAKIDYISLAPAQLHLQFKLSLPLIYHPEKNHHNAIMWNDQKVCFQCWDKYSSKKTAKRLIGRLYCFSKKDLIRASDH